MTIRPTGKAPNRAGFINFALLIAVTLGLTAPIATTCRTISTIAKNPRSCNAYSGTREDWKRAFSSPRGTRYPSLAMAQCMDGAVSIIDLPFSFIADTLILPFTGLLCLARGKPSSGRVDRYDGALQVDKKGYSRPKYGFAAKDMSDLEDYPGIRSLDLRFRRIDDESLEHLRHLPRLEALYLDRAGITRKGLVHIAKKKGLRKLSLFSTAVAGDLGPLLKLRRLEYLDISLTKLRGAALADLTRFPKLRTLRLDFTQLAGGGEHLKAMPHLSALRLVRVRNSPDTKLNTKALAALSKLRVLVLEAAYPTMDSKWMVRGERLEELPELPGLRRLRLNSVLLNPKLIKQLRKFPGLESLDLGYSSVNESSLQVLSNLPSLRNLRRLGLRFTKPGGKGLMRLRALKKLEVLDLRYAGVKDASLKAFIDARPPKLRKIILGERYGTSYSGTIKLKPLRP